MIKTFYNNFAPRDLEEIFWKNEDKSLTEFLALEYPTYSLRECKTALNTMLYNRKLILKEDRKSWTVNTYWMILERL